MYKINLKIILIKFKLKIREIEYLANNKTNRTLQKLLN